MHPSYTLQQSAEQTTINKSCTAQNLTTQPINWLLPVNIVNRIWKSFTKEITTAECGDYNKISQKCTRDASTV